MTYSVTYLITENCALMSDDTPSLRCSQLRNGLHVHTYRDSQIHPITLTQPDDLMEHKNNLQTPKWQPTFHALFIVPTLKHSFCFFWNQLLSIHRPSASPHREYREPPLTTWTMMHSRLWPWLIYYDCSYIYHYFLTDSTFSSALQIKLKLFAHEKNKNKINKRDRERNPKESFHLGWFSVFLIF